MRLERLMQIAFILLNRRKITASELATYFKVSIRTIYRDMDALSLAGFPIFAEQGTNGGYQLVENYGMDMNFFDIFDFQTIRRALESMTTLYQDQQLQEMIQKMGLVTTDEKIITADFTRLDFHNKHKYALLQQGITQKNVIQFSYVKSSTAEKRRAHPIQLFFHHLHWYLYAFCLEKKDFRIFKLSRLFDLTLMGDVFEESYTNHDGIATFQQWMLQMYNTINLQEIILRFKKTSMRTVFDSFPDETITIQENGDLIVTLHYPDEDWVKDMIFAFRDQVQIVAPASLLESMKEYIAKMYDYYFSNPDS